VAGLTWERVLRSPANGALLNERQIGDSVKAGDVIARVDGYAVKAAVSGVLRGLAYPGSPVIAGQKVGDIDARGDPAVCHTLSDKTRAISGAALEMILSFSVRGECGGTGLSNGTPYLTRRSPCRATAIST